MKFLFLLLLISCSDKILDTVTGEKVSVQDVELDTTETIEGIDIDKDGVRDDVQKWIDLNIKDPNLNAGMKQYAKYLMNATLQIKDRKKTNEVTRKTLDTLGCMSSLGYKVSEMEPIRKKINQLVLNTQKRIKAKAIVNAHFGGQEDIQESDEYYLAKCEFKYKIEGKKR